MTDKPNPTEWTKLRDLDSAALKSTFAKMAAQNVHWAMDQARCLAQHTKRGSDNWRALGEIGFTYGDTNTPQTALLTFELAANCLQSKDPRVNKALAGYTKAMHAINAENPKKAADTALLACTSLLANKKFLNTVYAFILDTATAKNPDALSYVSSHATIRSRKLQARAKFKGLYA